MTLKLQANFGKIPHVRVAITTDKQNREGKLASIASGSSGRNAMAFVLSRLPKRKYRYQFFHAGAYVVTRRFGMTGRWHCPTAVNIVDVVTFVLSLCIRIPCRWIFSMALVYKIFHYSKVAATNGSAALAPVQKVDTIGVHTGLHCHLAKKLGLLFFNTVSHDIVSWMFSEVGQLFMIWKQTFICSITYTLTKSFERF